MTQVVDLPVSKLVMGENIRRRLVQAAEAVSAAPAKEEIA